MNLWLFFFCNQFEARNFSTNQINLAGMKMIHFWTKKNKYVKARFQITDYACPVQQVGK